MVGGEAKKHKDIHKINLETITIKYKKDQIRNMQYFILNQDDFIEGDIQKFLLVTKNSKENKRKENKK